MIEVKVIRVPGTIQPVALDDGATVADALNAANISVSSEESVKLDGADTDMLTVLRDGARILVAKSAKGA